MQTTELTLRSLYMLSPDLTEDFNQQLEAAVQDCKQRPALAKARKVTIELKVTPHPSDPDDVNIEPVTKRVTPTRVIDPIRARRSARNQLQFDFDEADL